METEVWMRKNTAWRGLFVAVAACVVAFFGVHTRQGVSCGVGLGHKYKMTANQLPSDVHEAPIYCGAAG